MISISATFCVAVGGSGRRGFSQFFLLGSKQKWGGKPIWNQLDNPFSIQPLLLCSNSIIQWNYEVTIINIIDLWNITNYHHPILCFFTIQFPCKFGVGATIKVGKVVPLKLATTIDTYQSMRSENQKTNW